MTDLLTCPVEALALKMGEMALKMDTMALEMDTMAKKIDALEASLSGATGRPAQKKRAKRTPNKRRLAAVFRRARPDAPMDPWWETTLAQDLSPEQKALVDQLVQEDQLMIGRSGRIMMARKRAAE